MNVVWKRGRGPEQKQVGRLFFCRFMADSGAAWVKPDRREGEEGAGERGRGERPGRAGKGKAGRGREEKHWDIDIYRLSIYNDRNVYIDNLYKGRCHYGGR